MFCNNFTDFNNIINDVSICYLNNNNINYYNIYEIENIYYYIIIFMFLINIIIIN